MGCVLSVGLPVYNGELYLADALAGIRAQTFDDFELVIADNASTDRTGEIAKDAARDDPRIQYVRRDTNIGLVANWNRLFTDTRGEFFAWHASDDVADPEFYAACVGLLRDCSDAAAAVSEICRIDGDGMSLGPDPEHIRAGDHDLAVRFVELASLNHYCQFTYGVYRRSMMERTRLMLPFWSSDRLWLAELALQGRLLRDPRQLFRVREHVGRVTNSGRANFYAGLASPKRGTMWRYSLELHRAVDHAQLPPDDDRRVRQALRWWTVRNAPRLARSAAGAFAQAGLRAVGVGTPPRQK